MCVIYPHFELCFKFLNVKTIFFVTAWPSHSVRNRVEEGYSRPVIMTWQKKNQGETNKQCKYNTVLLTNWTEIKSLIEQKKKKKETNSINIYGTHLWHKYAAVGLATFLSFFLNQITMETVQKGREWGGHGLSIER